MVQSLSRQVSTAGGESGARLLHFEIIPAPCQIAAWLEVPGGSRVYSIQRLRFSNDLPFCIEQSHLPVDRFPGLTAAAVADSPSLYGLLEGKHRFEPARSEDRLSVAAATVEEAELLNLNGGEAVLYLRSIVYDAQNQPLEVLKSINHPALVVFQSSTTKSNLFEEEI